MAGLRPGFDPAIQDLTPYSSRMDRLDSRLKGGHDEWERWTASKIALDLAHEDGDRRTGLGVGIVLVPSLSSTKSPGL